ncbi:GNAT family N-acetyltransferase [Microbacterium sp. A94]|uniref:GNAT family N-acetyltransferase n=1 Tax=Microbacterium sp. A94 TaxID=3450717 RepID=UPI003F436D09
MLRAFLAEQLANGAILLISELDGAAAGYLLAEISARPANPFRHASKSLYVHHIAVDPALQRRRIGQELIDAAVAIGRAESVDAMRLDSWSFNTSAHAFFEAEGFTPLNVVFERKLL